MPTITDREIQLAQRALAKLVPYDPPRPPVARKPGRQHSLPTISDEQFQATLELVADYFEVHPQRIHGKAREQHTALARHLTISLLHVVWEPSKAELARRFDFTRKAIIHALNRIAELRSTDPGFDRLFLTLSTHLQAQLIP
jgi:chromosomal replication initiation ATPase DnaA